MILTIIGGASGVGKTSLLKSLADIRQINTGDLFKRAMILGNRDDIKKGDWSVYEEDVASDMAKITIESIGSGQDIIIDTHFAAKIFGKSYRIGLREEYLRQFGQAILSQESIAIRVVLVSTDPYLLLNRRRLDSSRNRELVPSDCYNDLRSNDIYSRRYSHTLRMEAGKVNLKCDIEYHVVDNDDFDFAQKQLTIILGR